MRTTSLDPLFSPTVQQILAALLTERAEPWYMRDLAKRLGRTASTLQRPLDALVAAGILLRRADGNRVYFEADPDCPILPELRSILLKTVGLADVLRTELHRFASRIGVAFVYGSIAKGEETSASDIDLLVIGETTLAEIAPALKRAEKRLSRPVNATVYSAADFKDKLAKGNHFLRSVLSEAKLFILGTQDELERLTKEGTGSRPQNKQGGAGRGARRRRAKP